jgi:soluble lytic murein transglycosylase-like protein
MLNSVNQVLNRINSIETRFSIKPANGDFSRQLTKAINAGSNSTTGMSSNQLQIEQMVRAAALRHGVKPELALAVARTESNLSQDAVSPVGAIGVMQLMPDTAQALGVRDSYDIRENIDGGVRYLKQMLGTFQDERLAVAAYNAGPEAVRQYRGIPPYAETQGYVKKVFNEIADGK